MNRRKLTIRDETPSDIAAISRITRAAFKTCPYSNDTEHLIINALRAADALTISLVAELDGTPAGHVALSPVTFSDGSTDWFGLGPIAVIPEKQKQGIGTALMNRALEQLRTHNAAGCILVGDPAYYTRFGFTAYPQITHEGVPPENVLALPFTDHLPTGQVTFHKAFSVTE
ncbi:putative acetyltransferase [Anaerohalosphaera lusitana]|uniref:Putative acetyltransferase n=1 Tax=Anaerohalosphaera lusitana TaxID=1936003 RepID=A0A1U9NIQ6_9BACT|nr:N-acetyltransferase [Anaerohalosphaera lusitana]AQT67813.1 putative acetyltransferase [Anaerohalosphaera lusitana]